MQTPNHAAARFHLLSASAKIAPMPAVTAAMKMIGRSSMPILDIVMSLSGPGGARQILDRRWSIVAPAVHGADYVVRRLAARKRSNSPSRRLIRAAFFGVFA